MSGPRRPPNNRQRVEDYYGVHDTGMGSRPAPAAPPPPPTVPPAPGGPGGPAGPPPHGPPQGQVPQGPPPRRPRVIPPPEVQVAAKEAARSAAGAPPSAPGAPSNSAAEPPRTKPDPLTDPLTSETFQGVQPASDTFEAGVVGGFGYSGTTGPQAAPNPSATGFDGGFDQFAPPRFEPRAEGRTEDLWTDAAAQSAHADGETLEATFAEHHEPATETLDEPDESYIDVEVVDVEAAEPAAVADGARDRAADEPGVEEPVADAAVADAPVVDRPDVEEPGADTPDVTAPVADAPVADEAAPAAEPPADPAPPAQEATTVAEEPLGDDEPAVPEDEPAAQDSTVQEPADEPGGETAAQPAPTLPEPLAIDPFPYTQIDETYVDAETLQNLQTAQTPHEGKEPGDMTEFNESLNEAMNIDGALGVALVDAQSGMALATAGNPAEFNLEVAAAGNSALVQAMGRTLGDLDLDDHIEDILITLGTQYQIVRPINQGTDDLFLYLVLDRSRANLAMARFRLTKLAEQIEV